MTDSIISLRNITRIVIQRETSNKMQFLTITAHATDGTRSDIRLHLARTWTFQDEIIRALKKETGAEAPATGDPIIDNPGLFMLKPQAD